MTKVIPVVIEAVQFTPGREPVIIQYAGQERKDGLVVALATGPLAKSNLHHTTQQALAARSPNAGYWGDAEVRAELLAHLEENGLSVLIDGTPAPPKTET